jgi:hypothetical protein
MGSFKTNIAIRLLPSVTLIVIMFILAFLWTDSSSRDGAFVYFLILLTYASVMLFFSDIIFLAGKKPLHVRIPFVAVAAVQLGYILIILLLRAIFFLLDDIYFVLATVLATALQIAISLGIFRGIQRIAGNRQTMDQMGNVRLQREVLLMGLTDSAKGVPALAQSVETMKRLEVFCNTWKFSPEQDTANTFMTTGEIDTSIMELTKDISAGNADAEAVVLRLGNITSLIERRKKLLQLK